MYEQGAGKPKIKFKLLSLELALFLNTPPAPLTNVGLPGL